MSRCISFHWVYKEPGGWKPTWVLKLLQDYHVILRTCISNFTSVVEKREAGLSCSALSGPTGAQETSAGCDGPAGVRGQGRGVGPRGRGLHQRAAETDGRFWAKCRRPPENTGDDPQTAARHGGGDKNWLHLYLLSVSLFFGSNMRLLDHYLSCCFVLTVSVLVRGGECDHRSRWEVFLRVSQHRSRRSSLPAVWEVRLADGSSAGGEDQSDRWAGCQTARWVTTHKKERNLCFYSENLDKCFQPFLSDLSSRSSVMFQMCSFLLYVHKHCWLYKGWYHTTELSIFRLVRSIFRSY